MLKNISRYWWCQIIGWTINFALSVFFVTTFGKASKLYFISLLITCITGLLITHIMRICIRYFRMLEKPVKKQVYSFLFLTLVFSILFGGSSEFLDRIIGYNPERLQKFGRMERLFLSSFNALWLILIWNMIYYIYHYVQRNQKQQLDTIRLESLVKSLELQTIKSHINPHFIFNALNSIRALVDENPERSRKAITELSNILRSSMQTEKMETVPLSQELNIVKDYLALEQMRFEERLKVEMHIADNTLVQPIPPMMLQILVENAIKHGISKNIAGGVIQIFALLNNNQLELSVMNTGKLNGYAENGDHGFGIKSTQDRLNLLHPGKAFFTIQETDTGMVESKISMPVSEL